MKTRITALALLGGLLAVQTAGHAQDKSSPAPPTPKSHRTTYKVQHGDAAALAGVLGKYFRGEAEVLAVPAGNALLISGSAASIEEVLKLLGELDRAPRTVEIEIVLAEIPSRKMDAKSPDREAPELDSGDPNILTKLEAMRKSAQIGPIQRIKLTAVEGRPVSSNTGGNRPFTSSTVFGPAGGGRGAFGGGGPVQRSVTYQAVGTTVRLTARVEAGNVVAVDLDLQDSQARQSEGADEGGAPSMDNSKLTTQLRVPSGRSVVAQSVAVDGKAGRTISLAIVMARVVEPTAIGNKQ